MPKSMLRSTVTNNQWYKSMLVGNPPPSNYELIQTVILSSAATSITFSSIPQDYKHLQARVVARTNVAAQASAFELYVNGNATMSNYYYHELTGAGTSAFSSAQSQQAQVGYAAAASAASEVFNGAIIDILDYTNTNKTRTIRSFNGVFGTSSNGRFISLTSNLYNNTTAITSLVFDLNSTATYVAGTRISLYGIRG